MIHSDAIAVEILNWLKNIYIYYNFNFIFISMYAPTLSY